MDSTLTLVIYILAAYRATRFLIQDYLFQTVRESIWKRFPPETSHIGYLLTCPWCLSMWVATLLTIGYILVPSVMFYIALALALSAAVGIIDKLLDRD